MPHDDAILPCHIIIITMLYWHINMPDRDIIMPHPFIMRPYCAINPLTSRPECMPGSRYTGVGVLFFVI